MKKFVFRLQVVLDRALAEEEEELLRLARLRQQRADQEQRINNVNNRRTELIRLMIERQEQAFDPWDQQQCYLHLEVLGNDLETLRAELATIERHIANQLQVLAAAMQKRQVLERLKEQRYQAYRLECEKQELKAMEETVLPRLAREQAAEQARLQEVTEA